MIFPRVVCLVAASCFQSLLHSYFLTFVVPETLFPGDVQFGRTANHQHFLKVPHCERKSNCQLFS
jgi:hypothetical protein